MPKKNIKINTESRELISLFNNITGAIIKDCVIYKPSTEDPEVIIFLVKKEHVGKAIGKAGENVKDLRSKLQKKVIVMPFSENLEEFTRFIFRANKNPIKIQNIEIREGRNQKKIMIISVAPQDRGRAIGKEGEMIKKARFLLTRHFNVDNVMINTRD